MKNSDWQRAAETLLKVKGLSSAPAFLMVALDQAVPGTGTGSAFLWRNPNGALKIEPIKGHTSDWDRKAHKLAPAYRCHYLDDNIAVNLHIHENRTRRSVHVKTDFVYIVGKKSGPWKALPIVYWNVGRSTITVEDHKILPKECFIAMPSDPKRKARWKRYSETEHSRRSDDEQDFEIQARVERERRHQEEAYFHGLIDEIEPDSEIEARLRSEAFQEREHWFSFLVNELANEPDE